MQEVSRVGAQGVTSKSKLLTWEMPDLHTGGLWADPSAARWLKGAQVGQRVDRTALEQAIAAKVVAEQDRRVEIPLIVLNRDFDFTTNPLGVKDLLGRGSSIFHGSPDYRNHNIRVGTEKLDGQIIRPGEVFSFNERIGDFTLAEGWVEGKLIVEDRH